MLDLGIGPGVSAITMGRQRAETEFIGLDLSVKMLARANINRREENRSPGQLSLLRADASYLPLADRRVDAVTGHSFLYLLPNYHPVLSEVNRVLKNGGHAAFLEPFAGQPDWSWLVRQGSIRLLVSVALWRFYSGLHRRFSAQSLHRALEEAGFYNVTTKATLGGFGLYGWAQKQV